MTNGEAVKRDADGVGTYLLLYEGYVRAVTFKAFLYGMR